MERHPLGGTGVLVSPIGLGTVKLGRTEGLRHPGSFELPSDDDAAALLACAADLGVNVIDTAPAYGVSEERLGELLRGSRRDWVIVTKAGEEFENGRSRFDFSPGAITASVERSLRRLRTDFLDVVLLHSDGDDRRIIEESGAIEALAALKVDGKIGSFGVSTKTPEGAMLAVERCDVVMLTLNPRHDGDRPAIEHARSRGVGVFIKKALLSGHVGAGHTPESCLRLALATPGVSSVIVGTINPDHLRENVRIAERFADGG